MAEIEGRLILAAPNIRSQSRRYARRTGRADTIAWIKAPEVSEAAFRRFCFWHQGEVPMFEQHV
jgi:hypothetical protein